MAIGVAIDVRNVSRTPSGIGVYVATLIRELSQLDGLEIHLFGTKYTQFPDYEGLETHILPTGARFHWAAIRKFKRMNLGVYHSPNSGIVPYFLGEKSVLTIHDLVPVLFPNTASIGSRLAHYFIKLASRKCGAIISVSESTKNDIIKIWNPNSDIHVIWSGSDRIQDVENTDIEGLEIPDEFYLCVGTLEPRKNLSTLLRAYFNALESGEDLPPILVVGSEGWRGESKKLLSLAERHPDKVRFCGYLDDGSLALIYSKAKALFFPSMYEGAGLPPLEAAYFGTGIVCSNIPSLKEVFADDAIFIDPLDVKGWERILLELNHNSEVLERLGENCHKTAKRYTFYQAAIKTKSVYGEVFKYALRSGELEGDY
tara:strand:+ start:537 stop:1649 length:1113 start_codon:yes stop_codon:yes gene_type:complete